LGGRPILVFGERDQEFARDLGLGEFLPNFRAADFTSTMFRAAGQAPMAAQLVQVLRSAAISGPVGVVGLAGIMPVEDHDYLTEVASEIDLRDATLPFSGVKAIKTEPEMRLIDEAYEIADEGFACFEEQVAVGRTEWEVCAEVERVVRRRGALQTYVMSQHGTQYPRSPTARRYRADDVVACFVELIAPNGCWVEKGATFVFPDAPNAATRVVESALRALRDVELTLRPGDPIRFAHLAAEKEAKRNGYALGIWTGHGVGIDHDVPTLDGSDEQPFQEGHVVAVHPHVVDGASGIGAIFCEQYAITKDGSRRFSRSAPEMKFVTHTPSD
jgi:Xaa-Pro aminopeptidase